MRIMIHSVPPWAPSGYGVQCGLLAQGLAYAGHDVTISAYGGFIREEPWRGIPVLACGGTSKGVGRIAGNYRRSKANAMITVCDLWPLDAREFEGMNVYSWLPVDCTPLSMLDELQLRAASAQCERFTPVAMTHHGAMQVQKITTEYPPVIPHMIEDCYKPGDRLEWRRKHSIPDDVFLISKVGVNGDYPARKCWPEVLAAFQVFHAKHANARLYLHTVAQPGTEGVDLIEISKTLGLRDEVGYPDQLLRLSDLLDSDYMAGMYRASDVLDATTAGEGFGVPVIESLACGTPVVSSRCTSMPELIPPDSGWLCDVQPEWCKLHNRWWNIPLVSSLVHCYEKAYRGARLSRGAAARAGADYTIEKVMPLWLDLLEG